MRPPRESQVTGNNVCRLHWASRQFTTIDAPTGE
jgi:hypothetical protein